MILTSVDLQNEMETKKLYQTSTRKFTSFSRDLLLSRFDSDSHKKPKISEKVGKQPPKLQNVLPAVETPFRFVSFRRFPSQNQNGSIDDQKMQENQGRTVICSKQTSHMNLNLLAGHYTIFGSFVREVLLKNSPPVFLV